MLGTTKVEGDDISDVGQVMREPFMDELPEHVQRLRRNLLITESASAIYKISGANISEKGSLLGLHFEGLNTDIIELSLLGILVYLLAHFVWASVDHFNQWKLRLSGIKDRIEDRNEGPDSYPDDVRQYTLYNWWKQESKVVEDTISCVNAGVKTHQWPE